MGNTTPRKAPIASIDAASADSTKAPRFYPAALPTGDLDRWRQAVRESGMNNRDDASNGRHRRHTAALDGTNPPLPGWKTSKCEFDPEIAISIGVAVYYGKLSQTAKRMV